METIAMETIVKIITIVETIILPNIMGTITRETIAKTVETFKKGRLLTREPYIFI